MTSFTCLPFPLIPQGRDDRILSACPDCGIARWRRKGRLHMKCRLCRDETNYRKGADSPQYKHGACETTEYNSWFAMRQRCLRKSHPFYKNYGGRGITICERWLDSFIDFLEDMGKKPSLDYSIERMDNNGNYEPANCKWATTKEQSSNKRPKTLTTHCRKGHERTTENTYVSPNGHRECRICSKPGRERYRYLHSAKYRKLQCL